MHNNELIRDVEKMFRYSGLIDQLRDTSRELVEVNASRATLAQMADQYTALRDALRETLAGDAAEQLTRWAPDLDREQVGADGIFFAAAQLARWVDLVHQTPKFLVAEELSGAAAIEASAKARATLSQIGETPSAPPKGASAIGSYL